LLERYLYSYLLKTVPKLFETLLTFYEVINKMFKIVFVGRQ